MELQADPEAMERCSRELMDVSRSVRRVCTRLEETEGKMRRSGSLQAQRNTVKTQAESLHVLSGSLVNLAAALQEIARLYGRTEEQCVEALDEPVRTGGPAVLGPADPGVLRQIHQLLGQGGTQSDGTDG